MNFTAIFCCYILLPYFESLVSPPQEAITCDAGLSKAKSKEDDVLTNRYFRQKRDHYHYNDAKIWDQRYMINGKHYDGNGIIFIMLGDDMNITSNNMQTGVWMKYVIHEKALCIGIELRSYSKKFPQKTFSLNDNLKYFNTEQVLADLAWFVYNVRNEIKTEFVLPEKLKWVAYGTGLHGSIATWFRFKFSHLIDAALVLGAPLLAKEEYKDFYNIVSNDLLIQQKNLWEKIQQVFKDIENRNKWHYSNLEDGRYNMEYYKSNIFYKIKALRDNKSRGILFKFCDEHLLDDLENRKKNLKFMYITFAKSVALVTQFGNMESSEDIMQDNGSFFHLDREGRIKRFILLVMNVARKSEYECLQINYHEAVSVYKSSKLFSIINPIFFPLPEMFGNRVSLFQKCTQYGQFEILSNVFGTEIQVNLDYYMEICNAVFGKLSTQEVLKKGVRKTNVFYGGLDIEVSNVVFVYADMDPYRFLGVYGKSIKNSMVLELKDTRNYGELLENEYVTAEKSILEHLKQWLQLSEDIEYKENEKIDGSENDGN